MNLTLRYGECRYLLSECKAEKLDVAYDPSGDVVTWAFMPPGEKLSDATWTAGTWETVGSKHSARILVGAILAPGADIVLPIGKYAAYWWVTDSPEKPIEPCGHVTVID